MKYGDGSEELYDMKKDPKQFTNLAKVQVHEEELLRQRKLFLQRMKAL